MKKAPHTRKRWRGIWLGLLLFVFLCASAFFLYVRDFYPADAEAVSALAGAPGITVSQTEDSIAFVPAHPKAGLIFYPGGKVEAAAYAPLMEACAGRGILSVLVEMPFHLAVLDVNAADGIGQRYPEIAHWYLGGHSLGGSMAASYLSSHKEAFDGLVLLGSYSPADLSQTNLRVLSVYGTEDKVLNRAKYQKNFAFLPPSARELVIEGGCHAYFGDYGPQKGDGIPTISREEQLSLTADAICELILSGEETAQ